MRNTLFEGCRVERLTREAAVQRVRRVIREELTELQRVALVGYYFQEKTMLQIAEERGVNRSTISRTLRRAEEKIKKYFTY